MKSLWSVLGTVAIAGLALAGPAHAQGSRGYGADTGRMFPILLRGVDLTDTQREQVRQIVGNHRPEFQRIAGELRAARETLTVKLYGPDPVGAADLAPLVEQSEKLRAQLTQEGVQVALEIRNILTPEQLARASQVRQRLNELRAEMRSLLGGTR
jgi:protein CpxP